MSQRAGFSTRALALLLQPQPKFCDCSERTLDKQWAFYSESPISRHSAPLWLFYFLNKTSFCGDVRRGQSGQPYKGIWRRAQRAAAASKPAQQHNRDDIFTSQGSGRQRLNAVSIAVSVNNEQSGKGVKTQVKIFLLKPPTHSLGIFSPAFESSSIYLLSRFSYLTNWLMMAPFWYPKKRMRILPEVNILIHRI